MVKTNVIYGSQIVPIGYGEPINLATAKAYLRIDNNASDSLLADILIPAARQAIESFTGLSLIEKSVTVQFKNEAGLIELPYGPVNSTIVFKDRDGNVLSNVRTIGFEFPLVEDLYSFLEAEYDAGYPNADCPADLKVAILDQLAHMYANRGDDSQDTKGICYKAQMTAQKYSRVPVIF